MKYAIFCVESRLVLRFATLVIFVASRTKMCGYRVFLLVLRCDAMSYERIENRKLGGESRHKIAFFMHRSICGGCQYSIEAKIFGHLISLF